MMDDDTMVAQVLSAHQEKMRDLMSAAESLGEQAIPAMPRFWWYRKIFAGAFHEDLYASQASCTPGENGLT